MLLHTHPPPYTTERDYKCGLYGHLFVCTFLPVFLMSQFPIKGMSQRAEHLHNAVEVASEDMVCPFVCDVLWCVCVLGCVCVDVR